MGTKIDLKNPKVQCMMIAIALVAIIIIVYAVQPTDTCGDNIKNCNNPVPNNSTWNNGNSGNTGNTGNNGNNGRLLHLTRQNLTVVKR